jgi:hypothetical protein
MFFFFFWSIHDAVNETTTEKGREGGDNEEKNKYIRNTERLGHTHKHTHTTTYYNNTEGMNE